MNWKVFFRGFLNKISIFNIGGSYKYPTIEEGFEIDRKALEGDWNNALDKCPDISKEIKDKIGNPFSKKL